MFATPSQVSILTVSKLNRFAKRVLESEIGLVWVSGEISNFVAASSGHWYFTLKDSQAQVKTAMFKGANQRAGFKPKAGDKVVVRANISLYEPRGDYQLIAQHIEPEGVGQLKQAYEALKANLQAEGLFAVSYTHLTLPTILRVYISFVAVAVSQKTRHTQTRQPHTLISTVAASKCSAYPNV